MVIAVWKPCLNNFYCLHILRSASSWPIVQHAGEPLGFCTWLKFELWIHCFLVWFFTCFYSWNLMGCRWECVIFCYHGNLIWNYPNIYHYYCKQPTIRSHHCQVLKQCEYHELPHPLGWKMPLFLKDWNSSLSSSLPTSLGKTHIPGPKIVSRNISTLQSKRALMRMSNYPTKNIWCHEDSWIVARNMTWMWIMNPTSITQCRNITWILEY